MNNHREDVEGLVARLRDMRDTAGPLDITAAADLIEEQRALIQKLQVDIGRLRVGARSTVVWKEIPGFEGMYEASSEGDVFSIQRPGTLGGLLSRHVDPTTGYVSVSLYNPGADRPLLHRVHRLILLTFAGPCPEGMEALHGDGTRTNNAASNLRWGTHAENMQDMVKHRKRKPITDSRKVLTYEQADYIRRHHKIITQVELAKMFKVSVDTIQRVHSGERYA